MSAPPPKRGGARDFIRGIVHSQTRSNAEIARVSTEARRTEPEWLSKFLRDRKYASRVLQELADREDTRASYRGLTPPGSELPPSSVSSLSAVPGTSQLKKTTEERLIEYYATRAGDSHKDGSRKKDGANRYADVLPYDRHSVFVNTQVGKNDTTDSTGDLTYLNASWVKERTSDVWWIASQGMSLFGLDIL